MGTGIGAVAGGVTGGLLAGSSNPVGRRGDRRGRGRLIGGAIGKSLDDEERRQLALASELAAEQPVVTHAPPKKVQWKRTDPETNTVTASGWVVPKSEPYQQPDGTTCREVTQSVEQERAQPRARMSRFAGRKWPRPTGRIG